VLFRSLWKGFVLRLRKYSIAAVQAVVLIGLLVLVLNCNIPACSAVSPAIAINNGAQFTNSTAVTLTLNANAIQTDIPSTAEMCIQNSNSNLTIPVWEPISTSKNWTLTSGDGLKAVFFSIRLDSNSNPLPAQIAIIMLDTTPPLLDVVSPTVNETVWGSSSLQAAWSARDMYSGVNHAEVSLDGDGWIDVGNQTTYSFTGLSDGTHTIAVMVVDNAGNSQTVSRSFTVNLSSSVPTSAPTSFSPTSSPKSTLPEGGSVTWLITGIAAAAVVIAAIIIVYRAWKKSKATKRA
jgi:hypothetical protein